MKPNQFIQKVSHKKYSSIIRNNPFTLLFLILLILVGVSCSQVSGQESLQRAKISETQLPSPILSVTYSPIITFTPVPTNTSTLQPTHTAIVSNTATFTPTATRTFSIGDYFNTGCIHSDFWIPKNPGQAKIDELGCWDLEPFGFIRNEDGGISIRPKFNIYEYWIYYPILKDAITIQCTVRFYNLSNDYFRMGFSGDQETPNPFNSFLTYRQSATSVISASYRNSSNQITDVLHDEPKFPHYITIIMDKGNIEIQIDDKRTSPPWKVIDSIPEDKIGFWIEYYVNNGLSYSVNVNACEFISE